MANDGNLRESEKPHLVVVGNGMAGMRAVEELLSRAPGLYDMIRWPERDRRR